jgi:hypothetical protein
MQMSLPEKLLVQVFRCARVGRRPNLTAFCRRTRATVVELDAAFGLLEDRGLLTMSPAGESLTLAGLALAAVLARSARETSRPLSSCRPLAA